MKNILTIAIILFAGLYSCTKEMNEKLDMAGEWQFQTDPDDRGENEEWYKTDLSETINLPGSMVENGKGSDITLETEWTGGIRNPEWYKDPNYAPYFDPENIRFPFWLQPLKKYTGAAWYQKTVTIPENWDGKSVFLSLERPHWQSSVWVNGLKVASQNSLATPHIYEITDFVKAGENRISVCIDNRTEKVDVGINSHSITDHTQTNWNGIVGDISLEAKGNIHFENLYLTQN